MADFFRLFRHSKAQFKEQSKTKNSGEKVRQRKMEKTSSVNINETRIGGSLKRYNVNGNCTHVSNEKWDEIWKNNIEEKALNCEGLVFINPNFAPSYYSPSNSFVCEFDSFNEYSTVNIDSMARMRCDQFEKWMKIMIQSSSCHVSMHCCQIIEILDRYCRRCPNLIRLSFHYYHLDGRIISYMKRRLPKLVSINLENSIGLPAKEFAKFGQMANLLHLNLSGCDVYENCLQSILENCPTLETLNISNNCSITGNGELHFQLTGRSFTLKMIIHFSLGDCLSHKTVLNLKRLNIKDCWRLTPSRLIEMVKLGLPNLIELLCNSAINDQSLRAIASNCQNLIHLDISFEEFTYYDQSGMNCLSDYGFMSISQMTNLKILHLRHVGRLTDDAFNHIIGSCHNLLKIVLNVRHRHKLTDSKALRHIGYSCPNLIYFEAVHNHFIGRSSMEQLSLLSMTLKVVVLRGDELIKDEEATMLIQKCFNLRYINLDGCPEIGEKTLAISVVHARKLPRENDGTKPVFHASLIMTSVERTFINSLASEFPENFRIRACDYRRNRVHYNEFDGKQVHECKLKERFYPYYWYDYN